ncbi:Rieske iron-sulfur domain-containing protein [Penicillium macrosclerotiorum]|uniref:Rieske iron-sulfur domain-containing protein n=1 Tax=Penicillium macrosclerotiorum TaxID=303699 RepID=UPI002547B1F4|nr:Rieske iron-sulfur domain-containing protein [Penicillium macrosclerotiorum]KAJ5669597.1 Rieske iron-sulfur domain-containing protein [Penicillium macrosclerotiorum]
MLFSTSAIIEHFSLVGWSYGSKGNIAKAPRFDTVHLHIDQLGFVWVNLDSSEKPSVKCEEQFENIDTKARITEVYNMDDYEFDHTWSLDGCNFKWKTLVENYNERYHCSTAHPGIAPHIQKDIKFDVDPKLCYIRHLGEDMEVGNIVASPTYMFPNSSVTMSRHFVAVYVRQSRLTERLLRHGRCIEQPSTVTTNKTWDCFGFS